ncbi:MAG: hypothetical protein ACRDFB_05610 [Rhabdochlamydiaceae bacterium]
MYKKILKETAVDPQNPTQLDKEEAIYLDKMRFDERLEKREDFTCEEFKQIYRDILIQYKLGKRSQQFVIDLSEIFNSIVFGGN